MLQTLQEVLEVSK